MKGRLENLFGALVTAVGDEMDDALESAARHGGNAPAALTFLARTPGCSIEALRAPLGLSHSAAVRLVDRLADDGLVARRSGIDGRMVSLVLTAAGRKRAERVGRARTEVLHRRLRHLRPGERRQLELLVDRLLRSAALDEPGVTICRLCDTGACVARRCPVVGQQLSSTTVGSRPSHEQV